MISTKTLHLWLYIILFSHTIMVIYNAIPSASASTLSNDENKFLPFDIGGVIGSDDNNLMMGNTSSSSSSISSNSTSSVIDDKQSQTGECDMPPCPPGEACMQMCP